jgi:hypothetical protein
MSASAQVVCTCIFNNRLTMSRIKRKPSDACDIARLATSDNNPVALANHPTSRSSLLCLLLSHQNLKRK